MNIAVFGAKGRVGSRVADIAKARGHNVWSIDKNYSENELANADVAINFATAEAICEVVAFCIQKNCPLINGTTGLDEKQQELLDDLSKRVAVVNKANFAIGVEMLFKLCEIVARELDWDCAIVETHRKNKKDAPSGTAKKLGALIAKNLGSFRSVETHALRLGSNFGRHEVTFAGEGESLTITHQAENADVFALGAVKEAERVAFGYTE